MQQVPKLQGRDEKMSVSRINNAEEIATRGARYLSPRQLAERWDCSRTTAQRIVDRAGLSKYFLGEGRNGLVRYAMDEVESFEAARCLVVPQRGRS